VVNHIVSAQLFAKLCVFRTGSSDNRTIIQFGDLDAEVADAGASTHDQHELTRFDLSASDQHVPCGEQVHSCSSGLLIADTFGNLDDVDFWQADLLSVASWSRLEAPDHTLGTVIFATAGAGFTDTTGKVGVNSDPVTDLDAGHFAANSQDITGSIGARGVWEFNRNRVAAHAPDVVIVQRRGFNLNQDFIWLWLGIRNLFDCQDVAKIIIGSVFFVDKCFHCLILSGWLGFVFI